MTSRKQLAWAVAAIGIVGSAISIVAYWAPSSATWLDRHGFIAWPLALLSLILFTWAAFNWRQSVRELETAQAAAQKPVAEDRRLFNDFRNSLPKHSPAMAMLRDIPDASTYYWADIKALSEFANRWRISHEHFVNEALDRPAQQLVKSADEYLSFLARYSEVHPEILPSDNTLYRVFTYFLGQPELEREVQKGLCERADKVLEAHDELYMTGSRIGL
jgi:hypothetical protein